MLVELRQCEYPRGQPIPCLQWEVQERGCLPGEEVGGHHSRLQSHYLFIQSICVLDASNVVTFHCDSALVNFIGNLRAGIISDSKNL